MATALHGAFNPYTSGSGFEAKDLAVLIAWGVLGVIVAIRYFTWEQRR
jgi:hypothetical protein